MAARTESEADPDAAAVHLRAARAIADQLGNPITSQLGGRGRGPLRDRLRRPGSG